MLEDTIETYLPLTLIVPPISLLLCVRIHETCIITLLSGGCTCQENQKGAREEGEGGGLKEYFYMTMGEESFFFLASGKCVRVRVRVEVLR